MRTLPQVIADGRDRDARERMLLGSLMAGMAFANSPCAAVHALAYPLGGHYHLPHGLTNSLMLVPVRTSICPRPRVYAQLGRAILGDSDPCRITQSRNASSKPGAPRVVHALRPESPLGRR
ncbi:MAG: iron-containing alcohol dehydrogenase [Betaproteobacteria bacterium]|nr:iron-containing alcohol dehydrogenase [Betaproteobacteria bacterium]